MKRDHYVKLIYEFIEVKPDRPYHEIEKFAYQMGATEEELKEAIFQAGKNLGREHLYPNEQVPIANIPVKKRSILPLPLKFTKRSLLTLGSLVAILVSGGLIVSVNGENGNDATQTVAKEEDTKGEFPLSPPTVYAKQSELDSDKIFSFPQADITLEYQGKPSVEVFGFLPYWMMSHMNDMRLEQYTTISFFGLTSDGDGNIVTKDQEGQPDGGWTAWNSESFDKVLEILKKEQIKTSVVIKSFRNDHIEDLLLSEDAQRKLISNITQLVNSKNLDGVNIDFEYNGKAPKTLAFAFARFIANLNAELKRQNPDSTLSIDAYLKSASEDDLIDVSLLAEHVEHIIVMGYDVHSPRGEAGPIAPMEGTSGVAGYMQSYLERVSPDKLILAVGYYGYDWPEVMGLSEPQILSYAEISSLSSKQSLRWDTTTQTPYYNYTDQQGIAHIVHYENARSLGVKYDYINKKALAGVGIWAMGYDGLSKELEQVLYEKFGQ